MKRNDLKKLWKVGTVYKDGKETEYYNRDDEWVVIDYSDFSQQDECRIKSERTLLYGDDKNGGLYEKRPFGISFVMYATDTDVSNLLTKLREICGNSVIHYINKKSKTTL